MQLEAFIAQVLALSGPPTFADVGPNATCPSDMQLVRGTHHRQVQRLCTNWHHNQCWSYFPGAVAYEWDQTPVLTCMDRYEWPNRKGATPVVMRRYTEAEAECASAGKRLCTEYEWELACEGPQALPYPYGHQHDTNACHNDQPYRAVSHRRLESSDARVRDQEVERLWQGEASGSHPACTSPFGVVDLVGNVEEWVRTSRPQWKYESSLKGGYWSKAWSGCRGTNDSHGPAFRFYEIGFRCCADPRP